MMGLLRERYTTEVAVTAEEGFDSRSLSTL